MIHKVISTSAIINQFNIAVLENLRETFVEVHFDIAGRVDPKGHQHGRHILGLLSASARHGVTPFHVQGVDRHDVAGRHFCETSSQILLQKTISILRL